MFRSSINFIIFAIIILFPWIFTIFTQKKEEFKDATEKADLTEESLKVALKQEIGQGLVTVEKKEDKVIVTVGAGGAFPSGTAQLTPAAKKIMSIIFLPSLKIMFLGFFF